MMDPYPHPYLLVMVPARLTCDTCQPASCAKVVGNLRLHFIYYVAYIAKIVEGKRFAVSHAARVRW